MKVPQSVMNKLRREAVRILAVHNIQADVVITVTAPEEMVRVASRLLKVDVANDRSQSRWASEARFICTRLLKDNYPYLNWREIGRMVGYKHTPNVIYAIRRANNFLECKDVQFSSRYEIAKQAVEQWLNE